MRQSTEDGDTARPRPTSRYTLMAAKRKTRRKRAACDSRQSVDCRDLKRASTEAVDRARPPPIPPTHPRLRHPSEWNIERRLGPTKSTADFRNAVKKPLRTHHPNRNHQGLLDETTGKGLVRRAPPPPPPSDDGERGGKPWLFYPLGGPPPPHPTPPLEPADPVRLTRSRSKVSCALA